MTGKHVTGARKRARRRGLGAALVLGAAGIVGAAEPSVARADESETPKASSSAAKIAEAVVAQLVRLYDLEASTAARLGLFAPAATTTPATTPTIAARCDSCMRAGNGKGPPPRAEPKTPVRRASLAGRKP